MEDKTRGKMKEAAGAISGDEERKAEGRALQRKAVARTRGSAHPGRPDPDRLWGGHGRGAPPRPEAHGVPDRLTATEWAANHSTHGLLAQRLTYYPLKWVEGAFPEV